MNADSFLAAADVEVKFHVFVRAGEDEPATYASMEAALGGPGSIMNVVKERAEKIAGRRHGIDLNPDISDTRVYKVQLPNDRCGACH